MAVRIEKNTPLQVDREIKTDTVWFENHNVEACIAITKKLMIEHIHLQTNTIEFLNDPRLQHVKGVTVQFDVKNIEPLFNLPKLTHLSLPEYIEVMFDFSKFKELIFLGGTLPKKYINLSELTNLKYTYLFGYREKDFKTLSNCKHLRKLWMYSISVENLHGLSNLAELEQIDLENCRKLASLDGLGNGNISLQKVHVANCKKLINADALRDITSLKLLYLHNIPQLQSLQFLDGLIHLEYLMLHPTTVGVETNDYYPLIEALQRIHKLENLKGWKPLKQFLNKEIKIEPKLAKPRSELQVIKENLLIKDWVEKRKAGLKQYSKKNCENAEAIIVSLIDKLEQEQEIDANMKEKLIEECILSLNIFNEKLGGSFIETDEREELCDLFDNIADAVGLNVQDYPDGIASKWRSW